MLDWLKWQFKHPFLQHRPKYGVSTEQKWTRRYQLAGDTVAYGITPRLWLDGVTEIDPDDVVRKHWKAHGNQNLCSYEAVRVVNTDEVVYIKCIYKEWPSGAKTGQFSYNASENQPSSKEISPITYIKVDAEGKPLPVNELKIEVKNATAVFNGLPPSDGDQ